MESTKKKKKRTLEKALLSALVGQPESDLRKQHVKRLIYGEIPKIHSKVKFKTRIKKAFSKLKS